ncbi:hypothetical protein DNH61_02565 [Paenibacillus sambharensis]|uniref:Nucleotidyltransferase family protein n=2 Tax=Paenibacillus sambharensis TaxID=1803190 RepID=A0A2W1LQN4_9BACL|nr:hypothetical protein DNH61_02565 [Paenibacillus sambharensis]
MDVQELIPLANRLEKCRIPYALGGSGMLHFFGLIDEENDWDLMVECPKDELLPLLRDYEFREQPSGDLPFASLYRITIPKSKIDIIGYFAFHTKKGVVNLPVRHHSSWYGVKICSPEVWFVAYKLLKRESKANLLKELLLSKPEVRDNELIKELLALPSLDEEIKDELVQLETR